MAIDSDGKLTKFKSGDTIVTADFANSIFGGLSGSTEGDSLDSDDPKIIGHIHDGKHADGHAGLINLVNHVDDKLLNKNLADNAVIKRNVRETIYQEEAIPEYDIIDGVKHYYLDLRQTKSEFTFVEDDNPTSADSGILENPLIRQRDEEFDGSSYTPIADVWTTSSGRDFVFGSPSLEDLNLSGEGDSRFFFDKSLSAFRAGSVTEDQWDESNRGLYSSSFGYNVVSSGESSFCAGNTSVATGASAIALGLQNSALSSESTITGGSTNVINDDSTAAIIAGGTSNSIEDSEKSVISGGENNSIYNYSVYSTISGGYNNTISIMGSGLQSSHSVISGGSENEISGLSYSSLISGGYSNSILSGSSYSGILSGDNCEVTDSTNAVVAGGSYGQVDRSNYSFIGSGGGPAGTGDRNRITNSDNSSVVSGRKNIVEGSIDSSISGGIDNQINSSSGRSFIGSGEINRISGSTHCFVGSGNQNNIFTGSPFSAIASGELNEIRGAATHSAVLSGKGNYVEGPATNSAILSGYENFVQNSFGSAISSGRQNSIQGAYSSGFNSIVSGETNFTNETDYCQILSGKGNFIAQNSFFSSILGGESNQIILSNNSSILSGKESNIKASASAVLSGAKNRIEASAFETLDEPSLSVASGKMAWSYMFGQKTFSSGGYNSGSTNFASFPNPSPFSNGSNPTAGTIPDVWNLIYSDRGSSQRFSQTMFGSFSYDNGAIPSITIPQKVVASLDGGYALSSAERGFVPRANSSYAIRVLGVISCAELGGGNSVKYSVSFELSCGVSVQPNGIIDYSSNTSTFTKIHDSLSVITGGVASIQVAAPNSPSGVGPNDFEIFFTHDTAAPTAFSSGVPLGSDLKFVLINNTFLNASSPGSTNSNRVLYGEAISLAIEVTEVNLSLYHFQPPP